MPALSPTMEKGNLAKWLKKEGDKISSGDVIAEIETDKATMEVEAVDEGTLAKIVVPEGAQDVPVNSVIAVLAGEGEDVKAAAAAGAAKAPPPSQAKPAAKPAPSASSFETPAARAPQAEAKRKPSPWRSPPQRQRRRASRRARAGASLLPATALLLAARAPAGERSRHRSQPRAGLRPAWPCDRARHRRGEIRQRLARAGHGAHCRYADAAAGHALRRANPRALPRRLLRLRAARQYAQDHRAAPHAVEADHPAFLSHARLRHRPAAWPRARRSTPPRPRHKTASRPTRFRSTISSSRRWRSRCNACPTPTSPGPRPACCTTTIPTSAWRWRSRAG